MEPVKIRHLRLTQSQKLAQSQHCSSPYKKDHTQQSTPNPTTTQTTKIRKTTNPINKNAETRYFKNRLHQNIEI